MTRKDFAQAERRPRYERAALGFVGICVVGMYATATFSPVKLNTFTMSLKKDGAVQGVVEKTPPIMEAEPPYVFSMALPLESDVIIDPVPVDRVQVASLAPTPVLDLEISGSASLSMGSPADSYSGDAVPSLSESYMAHTAMVDKAYDLTQVAAVVTAPVSQPQTQAAKFMPPTPVAKPSAPSRPKTYIMANAAASYAGTQIIARPASGMSVKSSGKLAHLFASLDYSLNNVRDGGQPVPRVFLTRLPRDLEEIPSVGKRKAIFLKAMLPLILQANESVLSDRRRLLSLRGLSKAGGAISSRDKKWMKALAKKYRVKGNNIESLLARVDVVPTSLALTQAIEESGWGTSRFAQMGNAPFGQWTYNENSGLIPLDRDEGQGHAVKSYSHLLEGVESYIRNLNTHNAYRSFREKRLAMRRDGQTPNGQELIATLTNYSARGDDYIVTLNRIMTANDLMSLDRARLNGAQMARMVLSGG